MMDFYEQVTKEEREREKAQLETTIAAHQRDKQRQAAFEKVKDIATNATNPEIRQLAEFLTLTFDR